VAPPAAPLIVVAGPTAAGKSALALRLASERGGEIVSCDSLQVYRGLDVGSAKPAAEERRLVRHHLVDVVDPDADFSAADYARLARAALCEIAERGALPIVVGGSGLYLRALLQGLFQGPPRDATLRRRLEGLATRFGDARLHQLLARVDPEAAARIAPRDRVRVVRALEVYRLTQQRLSEHHRVAPVALAGFSLRVLVLNPPRETLRAAVERRTSEMFERGLLAEVAALLAKGYAAELRPLQSIGYRQALDVLAGRRTPEQAQRDIVTETMRYAKRQRTWFRHQTQGVWCQDASEGRARAGAWLDGEEA
jgi:tRNA dimethylallyltransferase